MTTQSLSLLCENICSLERNVFHLVFFFCVLCSGPEKILAVIFQLTSIERLITFTFFCVAGLNSQTRCSHNKKYPVWFYILQISGFYILEGKGAIFCKLKKDNLWKYLQHPDWTMKNRKPLYILWIWSMCGGQSIIIFWDKYTYIGFRYLQKS